MFKTEDGLNFHRHNTDDQSSPDSVSKRLEITLEGKSEANGKRVPQVSIALFLYMRTILYYVIKSCNALLD
jgi:hypothetical protein